MQFIYPSIIIINGSPGSGKTNLLKYLLVSAFKKNQLAYGIVFCPTAFNQSYNYLDNKYVFTGYNEEVLINLMNVQIQQLKNNNKCNPSFVVFDDCIGTIDFGSSFFNQLISTYRHYNLTLIFSTQYLYKLTTLIRSCCTYFITFNESIKRNIQAIYETFMGEFDTYNLCKKFIQEHCKDYKFIVVLCNKSDNKFLVCKAPLMMNNNIKIEF